MLYKVFRTSRGWDKVQIENKGQRTKMKIYERKVHQMERQNCLQLVSKKTTEESEERKNYCLIEDSLKAVDFAFSSENFNGTSDNIVQCKTPEAITFH